MRRIALLLLCTTVMIACKKKPDPVVVEDMPKATTGELRMEIEHIAGNQPLVLSTSWYQTENKDSIRINKLAYFLSNFKLAKKDGTQFVEPESYYLVQYQSSGSVYLVIKNLPPGEYTGIDFLVGVDSLHNVSGAQTGALDPLTGMFWDWNSGYIMAKMEGDYMAAGKPTPMAYHLGGFRGFYNVLRTIKKQVSFTVEAGKTVQMHVKADALEWFKTPNIFDVKKTPMFMSSGKDAAMMADNYTDMFTISHVE